MLLVSKKKTFLSARDLST